MNSSLALGIDGGATKVLAQTCTVDQKSSLIIPQKFQFELNYSDSSNFNSGFKPIEMSNQKRRLRRINIDCQKKRSINL